MYEDLREEIEKAYERLRNQEQERQPQDPDSSCSKLQAPEEDSLETETHKNYENFSLPVLFPTKALFELGKSYWTSQTKENDVQCYLRGCKWSPDGTMCLTIVNNDGMHVVPLSTDLYDGEVKTDRPIDTLESVVHVKEGGLVYDFCWFPGMDSRYPETSCWLTTKQNSPIQLWDGTDGELRCTYRGYNAVDEVEPAISVCFSDDGSKIIGGYKKSLKTFDVHRPGRDCDSHSIQSPASSLATNGSLLAVGSWNTTISLYSINEYGTYKSVGKMYGHSGGVTHMKFLPDGAKVVTGARKDHRLLIWDIRFYRKPLNILKRVVNTNQRIYFDVSECGRYLVSGGTDGILRVWDSDVYKWHGGMDVTIEDAEALIQKFPIHSDCCNSVSVHPCRPLLATGSGQHHALDPTAMLDIDIENTQRDHQSDYVEDVQCTENSLLFWWIGELANI